MEKRMRSENRFQKILIACIFGFLYATAAMAQSDRGALAGTITDSTGAVVPNAAITVTGADTGEVYNAVTSSVGSYRIQDMVLGAYNIKVAATGFKGAEHTGVVIQVNSVIYDRRKRSCF
jgi:hypothetical protein